MENEATYPEMTHDTVADAIPRCDCCGEELTPEDLEAIEAEAADEIDFIDSLLQCVPTPGLNPFELQSETIRLPEPGDTFALADYAVTLSCLLSVPSCGHTGHYFPVKSSLHSDLWPWLKETTFHLAVSADGGLFLIPEDEEEPDQQMNLTSVLRAAASQPFMVETCQQKTLEVTPADVDIDSDVSVEAFEDLLRDAFQGFVVDDLHHPIIDILLSDGETHEDE